MSKEKKLVKNTLIYFIGNFSSKFLSLLLLPFYTNYLDPSQYGYADIILSTVSLMTPIITFQLMDGSYRYTINSTDKHEQSKVISSAVNIILRNFIIADLIFILIAGIIHVKFMVLILLQLNFTVINTYILQISRGLRKNHIYSIAGVLSTFVMLSLNIILIAFSGLKVEGLLISNIASYIVSIIYVTCRLRLWEYINFKNIEKNTVKKLIVYSLPLLPNYLNWWVMNLSDRFIINYKLGLDFNGIYAISNKFPSILLLLCSIFNMAWQESAILEYESDERDKFYTSVFNSYSTLLLTAVIVLLSYTRLIFKVAINPTYSSAYYFIPYLYLGIIFSSFSSFYGIGYQAAKETKGAFYTSVIGSVVNILVNISLISIIGLQAASISTMLGFGSMWVIRMFNTRKYLRIGINVKKLITLFIITIIFISIYYSTNNLIVYVSYAASGLIFVFFNLTTIKMALDKILKSKVQRRKI
jgi:O-antigen/teichoic acid export membrane protein